jgi:restriction system protein
LKKYGLINNSERGIWSLTAEGTRQHSVDPRDVVQFVQQQIRNSRALGKNVTSSADNVSEIFEELEDETATWRDELLDTMLTMPPDAFERLCQRMLRESGFIEVEVTGRSGEGGIDGHGTIRIGGLISFNVLFQSKRHRGSIGANVVRDFRGAMIGRADKGLVISTGSFTRDAQKEATRDGAPPIDLIDGELLVDKLEELRLGVKIEQIEVVQVDKAWFDNI